MSELVQFTEEDIARIQPKVLEMLLEFDRVCRKHGIRYSISGGTLLGAVRHKGFIPWDDDGDIDMLREDYDRFVEVCDELDPSICFFQDHDTEPEYLWGYAKLRYADTVTIRGGQEHLKFRTGLCVDIMPKDDVPRFFPLQMLDDFRCYCLRKILWGRVGRYDYSNSPFIRNWYALLCKIPVDWVFKQVRKKADKSSNDTPNRVRTQLFNAAGKLYKKSKRLRDRYGWPKEWMFDLVEYDFEGHKLWGMRNYDEFLELLYGDYMTLPPEDKRLPKPMYSVVKF